MYLNQNIRSILTKAKTIEQGDILRVGLPVAGFALLTAIAALIRIPLPFTPVPITMQTFVVLLSGVMLGGGKGSMSQIIYVSAGVIGLPIFAGMTSGIALLSGATGGFLAGFIVAPKVVGLILGESKERGRLIIALVAGTIIIFLSGNLWLWIIMNGSIAKTLSLGFIPFLPGAVIKIGLVIAVVEALRFRNKNN